MARVSLIPLLSAVPSSSADRLDSFRDRLERAGHSVEVVDRPADVGAESPSSGLVRAMVDRLADATGELVVVVDRAMGYRPDDLAAVVDRLAAGPASLAVATRRRRLGPIWRRLCGTADPTSGLIALRGDAARGAAGSFAPVGSRFACELLARVPGPRVDVPVGPVSAPSRRWAPLDDVRHAKRIADDRLGTMSRLLQFCFVGASGMVVDLTCYAALLAILSRTPLGDRTLVRMAGGGSPISLAGVAAAVLAIAVAMSWNFALNRRLTFNDARRGSIVRQYLRYALSNLAGIAVSLGFRLILPGSIPFFARHRLMAAVAGIVAATGISFSLSRWFVFNSRKPPTREPIAGRDGAGRLDPKHDLDHAARFRPAECRVPSIFKMD